MPNTSILDNPDFLRSPDSACKPDVRNTWFMVHTMEGTRPVTLRDHYDAISGLTLDDGVPVEVRIHFETTKNLYLYSWFVYRFFPIALHYSFVSLEFALRLRFEAEIVVSGAEKRKYGPGLRKLMTYAIENGYLKNEGFFVWRHRTEMRARQRTSEEMLQKMMREGLTELEYDENNFTITENDRNHDILESLKNSFPNIRNHYAHGSRSLSNHALSTIQIVSEIINQIYNQKNDKTAMKL